MCYLGGHSAELEFRLIRSEGEHIFCAYGNERWNRLQQNQLEILPPAILDGVQTLDHETDNKEAVKIKAVEKETKAEQGERKTEEHLNETKVETRNDEAKHSGAVPMGFETARSPEKRDDGLTPPSLEKGGKDSPEVVDVGSEYGLVKAAGAKRPFSITGPQASVT
ncbi:hypothetical protein MRB53_023249 [Persea americana]|uniref:Uncharacterized protein n=1 Tax=Persea americana TaxID=3435 RepID=A0ACC2L910_PERAE|nr:hypothetical protein MRB53_023249 [Persea americana]